MRRKFDQNNIPALIPVSLPLKEAKLLNLISELGKSIWAYLLIPLGASPPKKNVCIALSLYIFDSFTGVQYYL